MQAMNLEQCSNLKGINALPRVCLLWGQLVIRLMNKKTILPHPLHGQKGDRSVYGNLLSISAS